MMRNFWLFWLLLGNAATMTATGGCGPDEETRLGNLLTGQASDTLESSDIDPETPPGDEVDRRLPPRVRILDRLNSWRRQQGQSDLRENPLLRLAAQNHADYLAAHPEGLEPGSDPHLESPESPKFTGLKVQQRIEYVGYPGKSLGENIALRATAEAAVQSWLETLYSRLPLMDLALEDIGLGEAGSIHERIFVLVAGTQTAEQAVGTSPRFYPADGEKQIMAQWNGNELPQPEPPPTGYPSGPVISLHTGDSPFDGVIGTLRNSEGQVIACNSFTMSTDPNLPPGVAALIPYEPLESNASYSVAWKGSLQGNEFDLKHTFKTAPNSCQPTNQDCGHGRACYIQQGDDTCLWVGPLSEGDTCLYINDCARGLGCYGLGDVQTCRRYCSLEGPKSCDIECEGQYSVLDDTGNTGFCWNVSKE